MSGTFLARVFDCGLDQIKEDVMHVMDRYAKVLDNNHPAYGKH